MLFFAHCIIIVITPATTIIMIIKRMLLDIRTLHDECPMGIIPKKPPRSLESGSAGAGRG
jgi:hypothetical protein